MWQPDLWFVMHFPKPLSSEAMCKVRCVLQTVIWSSWSLMSTTQAQREIQMCTEALYSSLFWINNIKYKPQFVMSGFSISFVVFKPNYRNTLLTLLLIWSKNGMINDRTVHGFFIFHFLNFELCCKLIPNFPKGFLTFQFFTGSSLLKKRKKFLHKCKKTTTICLFFNKSLFEI